MTTNTFANAVQNQSARTDNGMLARKQTGNACTDLFFKSGAMRGKDIIPDFSRAFVENPDIATRVIAWLRDVRGGAGERELFRNVLRYLEKTYPDVAIKFIPHIPEIGRWDDLLIFSDGSECQTRAFELIKQTLDNGDGLAAKWMPREKSSKGNIATQLRKFLNMDPKSYRKKLAALSNTVEDNMCAKEWSSIEYSHVPSMAHSKYKKAFHRNDPERYVSYIKKVLSGDKTVKINAEAIFPHDVIRGYVNDVYGPKVEIDQPTADAIRAQWEALPNYVENSNILPVVDVSGSMSIPVQMGTNLTCLEVAVSLGLYLSEKNTGKFKDICVTFSEFPDIIQLTGTIIDRMNQLVSADWGMNTNLEKTMNRILEVAVENSVPESEMPEYLLILSDMNFDQCVYNNDVTAFQMIQSEYEHHGYQMPRVVFWNINAQNHVPVKFDQNGTALVSGFSPSILTAILSDQLENFTPEHVMLEAVMKPRYNIMGDS